MLYMHPRILILPLTNLTVGLDEYLHSNCGVKSEYRTVNLIYKHPSINTDTMNNIPAEA